MFYLFLGLAILAALILYPAILFQAGQGGGLSTQFGGSSSSDAFGNRQASTILHKAAWWAGGIFLGLCFLLQLMSVRTGAVRSLTEEQLRLQQQSEQAPPPPLQQLPLENTPQTAPAPAPTPPTTGTTKRP